MAMKSAFISIPFFDSSQGKKGKKNKEKNQNKMKTVSKKLVHSTNSGFAHFRVHALLQWTSVTWS